MTNFARIVPVLSSNSESVLKTGLVFAYELRFQRSIYQNRSKKILPPFSGSADPKVYLDWKMAVDKKN